MKQQKRFWLAIIILALSAILMTACSDAPTSADTAVDKQTRMDELQIFLNPDGSVNGDTSQGEYEFMQVCKECHGEDGRDEDLGENASPVYIGTVANADPAKFFEMSNFGDAEREMPGFSGAMTLEQLINILAYAQTLPVK